MGKIIIKIETQTVFPKLSAKGSDTSALQACQGNYGERTALILIPVKEQNGNCWFAIHVHQQDLGPCLEILKGYQANKYSLLFLFFFFQSLLRITSEPFSRSILPGVQCLEHLGWNGNYLTDLFQQGAYSQRCSGWSVCSCGGCLARNSLESVLSVCCCRSVLPEMTWGHDSPPYTSDLNLVLISPIFRSRTAPLVNRISRGKIPQVWL